jgi:hypothetical protein
MMLTPRPKHLGFSHWLEIDSEECDDQSTDVKKKIDHAHEEETVTCAQPETESGTPFVNGIVARRRWELKITDTKLLPACKL